MNDKTESPDWKHNPLIVGLLVLFCFPLGLFLVWMHPTWAQRTKWIITGVFALCVAFGGILSEGEKASIAKKLAEADAQWSAGKKAEAVTYYKLAEGKHWSKVADDAKPVILSRIVEFHADAGQDAEAKKWIAAAKQRSVPISTASEKATLLIAAVEAETNRQPIASSSSPATSGKPIGPQPDLSVTAFEMATDKASNALRFDTTYQDKRTQITGIVKKVEKAAFGQQYVDLEGTDKFHVVCYFDSLERKALESLNPGERVSLIGTYKTTVLSAIWIIDCRMATPGSSGSGASTSSHPKLAAFLALVAKYKQSPNDPLTTDTERIRFIKEVEPLQKAFGAISFDPAKHPNEARQMIDTFQQSIYRKYSGDLYNVFEAEMLEMTARFVER